MRRRARVLLLTIVSALVVAGLATVPSTAAADPGRGRSGLEVYVGSVTAEQLQALRAAGFDHEDLALGDAIGDLIPLEVAMTAKQAAQLKRAGVDLDVKRVGGKTASELLAKQASSGYTVFRRYGGPGGLSEELQATAAASPLAQLVDIGSSLKGTPIHAVRVTRGAETTPHGSKPSVLYNGAQHAREWITPEMVRRLMHQVINGYGKDPRITRLVDTRELWFLPVANPDGYDFTFEAGNRLWRKNLRDNDGDGVITGEDGVDPNRNFPTHWGLDDEGSSPHLPDATYRGTGPASEPETQAMIDLVQRVGFAFQVNYHSAAELLLYGTGWQVSTPSPDDVIYETLVGDDRQPAVPGYDPDLSAELYITNGETTDHMHNALGTLAITPEMSTCETASAIDKNDQWRPEDCLSVFNFPDDERLIAQEVAKNVPMALAFAESSATPATPVSSVGKAAAPLVADTFAVSHGTTQPVAVMALKSLTDKRVHYRVNGGQEVTAPVTQWTGGKRYGTDGTVYYGEYRGTVTGTKTGDRVQVWFSAKGADPRRLTTTPFVYTVAADIGGDVLVLAAEDRTGISGLSTRSYVEEHASALNAAGYSSDVYDVDANNRTAPHHLGVLSHYRAVIWETGDDVIPRVKGQPGGTAAKLALELELAARDYMNEGGKLVVAGQYALFAQGADGVYYYNPFAEQGTECRRYATYPCIPLGNDFLQYWLGAYETIDDGGTGPDGPLPLEGAEGDFFDSFVASLNAPGSAGNQRHTSAYLTTSSFLPEAEFPWFGSSDAPLLWDRGTGPGQYEPYTGDWMLYSQQSDNSYKRLSRTVDLTGASDADLTFQTSYAIEDDWDYLFVEARPVDTEQWTTLPDANGHTSQGTGASCPEGWRDLHPQLNHYQGADCSPTGTSGVWHAATGKSGGWQDWKVDLSAYAGQQVELSISYASDWAFQFTGVLLDDLAVTVGDTRQGVTSFEIDDLAGWSVAGPPPGSATTSKDWTRAQTAFEEGAAVSTAGSVLFGFGLEGLQPAQRSDAIARALQHLLS
jgi:hypothetical protein